MGWVYNSGLKNKDQVVELSFLFFFLNFIFFKVEEKYTVPWILTDDIFEVGQFSINNILYLGDSNMRFYLKKREIERS